MCTDSLRLCYIFLEFVLCSDSLQKKVNPELPVEIKPSNRARKLQESKLKKQKQKAVLKRQRDDEQRWHIEMRSAVTLAHRPKLVHTLTSDLKLSFVGTEQTKNRKTEQDAFISVTPVKGKC